MRLKKKDQKAIIFSFFSSIKLTLVLLSFSFLLVFFGTLDQVEWGIHEVQKRYFQSFFAIWSYPETWPQGHILKNYIYIPLLGGSFVGILLLINLALSSLRYITFQYKKIGIILIHAGLFLLIISGFCSSFLQKESQMILDINQAKSYAENYLKNELVIIDKSQPTLDLVWAIDQELLRQGQAFENEVFGLNIKVEKIYPNALLTKNNTSTTHNLADKGAGLNISAIPQKPTYKPNTINAATAYISVFTKQEKIGTWLVSNIIDEKFPPQEFTYESKKYHIVLRFERTYFPFSLTLLEFTHEKHPGTNIPKNFSSLVRIQNKNTNEDRTYLISMNKPLRYQGYSFYQASFSQNEQTSILQVVKNPSWALSYIAIGIVTLGLLLQFGYHLWIFLHSKAYLRK